MTSFSSSNLDLARNIYYNATVEKIALIRFMANTERKLAGHVDELTHTVTVRLLQPHAAKSTNHAVGNETECGRVKSRVGRATVKQGSPYEAPY